MTAGRIPESLRIFRVRWDRAVAAQDVFLSVVAAQAGLAALKSAGGEMRRELR